MTLSEGLTKTARLFKLPIQVIVPFSWFAFKIKINSPLNAKQLEFYGYYHFLLKTDFKWDDEKNIYLVSTPYGQRVAIRKYPSSDVLVFDQVFFQDEYKEVARIAATMASNKKELTIIDAGANVGYSSVFFTQALANYQLRIIAIEPDSGNAQMLEHNMNLNGITISIERAGLYNKSCFLKITNQEMKEWSFQVEETNDTTGLKSIELNDLLSKYSLESIDILKIDIEGAERFLFEDKEYAAKLLKNVKLVALEIHDQYPIRATIYQRLEENGFTHFESRETTIAYRKQS
jgi:FkbM family methyltransferase